MSLTEIIDQLGLPGLFALGIFDGEAAAILGGVLAHHGLFRPELAALTVSGAGVVSDNLLFATGRLSERFAKVARLLARPSLSAIRQRIERHPSASVLSVRFLYGLHGIGTVALGASPVRWLQFAALNLLSVTLWAHLWVWGGSVLIGLAHRIFGRFALEVGLSLAAAAAVLIYLHGQSRRRKTGRWR